MVQKIPKCSKLGVTVTFRTKQMSGILVVKEKRNIDVSGTVSYSVVEFKWERISIFVWKGKDARR